MSILSPVLLEEEPEWPTAASTEWEIMEEFCKKYVPSLPLTGKRTNNHLLFMSNARYLNARFREHNIDRTIAYGRSDWKGLHLRFKERLGEEAYSRNQRQAEQREEQLDVRWGVSASSSKSGLTDTSSNCVMPPEANPGQGNISHKHDFKQCMPQALPQPQVFQDHLNPMYFVDEQPHLPPGPYLINTNNYSLRSKLSDFASPTSQPERMASTFPKDTVVFPMPSLGMNANLGRQQSFQYSAQLQRDSEQMLLVNSFQPSLQIVQTGRAPQSTQASHLPSVYTGLLDYFGQGTGTTTPISKKRSCSADFSGSIEQSSRPLKKQKKQRHEAITQSEKPHSPSVGPATQGPKAITPPAPEARKVHEINPENLNWRRHTSSPCSGKGKTESGESYKHSKFSRPRSAIRSPAVALPLARDRTPDRQRLSPQSAPSEQRGSTGLHLQVPKPTPASVANPPTPPRSRGPTPLPHLCAAPYPEIAISKLAHLRRASPGPSHWSTSVSREVGTPRPCRTLYPPLAVPFTTSVAAANVSIGVHDVVSALSATTAAAVTASDPCVPAFASPSPPPAKVPSAPSPPTALKSGQLHRELPTTSPLPPALSTVGLSAVQHGQPAGSLGHDANVSVECGQVWSEADFDYSQFWGNTPLVESGHEGQSPSAGMPVTSMNLFDDMFFGGNESLVNNLFDGPPR